MQQSRYVIDINFNDYYFGLANKYEAFLQGLIKRSPVFAPFTSPIYSNDAFSLISFALEAITNKTFTDMMDNMFDQLNLYQTSYTTPSSDGQGVIPWNVSYSGWDLDEAATNPLVILFHLVQRNLY